MKRTLCLFIATILLCSALLVSIAAGSFTDVPSDAYYAEAAERMAKEGILSGFGDGRYYGDFELTRAQFAALACKLLGKVDEAVALAGKTDFADVPETHWSTGYVNYAAANKIINGDGDGKFRPDDSVKYEEAIKVIVCVLKPDNNIVIDKNDWSKNFIVEAEKLGLLSNLIGKKGEYMKRSDIAVIADAAYAVLGSKMPGSSSTTKRPSTNKPSSGNTSVTETTETTTQKTPAHSLPPFVNNGTVLPFSPEE